MSTSAEHPKQLRGERPQQAAETTIHFLSLCNTFVFYSVDLVLLLFLRHVHMTTTSDLSVFTLSYSLECLMPFVGNAPLGYLSNRFGTVRVMLFTNIFVALGLFVLCFARTSRTLFLLAFSMFSVSSCFRMLRTSLLADVVAPSRRTSVMTVHELMRPISELAAPAFWLAVQLWRGSYTVFYGALVVDRFSIVFLTGAAIMLLKAVIVSALLTPLDHWSSSTVADNASGNDVEALVINPNNSYGALEEGESETVVQTAEETARRVRVSRMRWVMLLCFILLCSRFTLSMYDVLFQPILINYFSASDAAVGHIYLLVSVLAIIPLLAGATLARWLRDRALLLSGLLLQAVGATLALPWGGAGVSKLRVIGAYMCVVKAATLMYAAALSLLTKKVGTPRSAQLLGGVWSTVNAAPAVAQFTVAATCVRLFGTWWFVLLGIPVLLAIAPMLHPKVWRAMGEDDER